ncbi:MAG TPA: flavodoxin domain-containing protein [Dehalococcoidia bacterium]|jgi:menaquinone-dependent protoporphyrinogen IX oxidase|nr:flavodoxin domain-containing protein [Dehalococcoidia bacterium]
MRTVIIYNSLLGTTKKYAMWLREALEADVSKANAGRRSALDYDLIIVCSPTYMGQIRLLGYLKKRWSVLQGKRVILIAVGMAPPESPDSRESYESIPEEIRNRIRYFKLPGKIGPAGRAKVKQENLQPVLEYIRSIRG